MRVDPYTGFVYQMSYAEKNELAACLKPIKTYDYAYIKPHDLGSSVIAIRASSSIALMDIPYRLSGNLCISLKAFINLDRAMDITNPTPDIYFPDLDTVLSKYIWVAQSEVPYIYDGEVMIFIQAYHMIQELFDIVTKFASYKQIVELDSQYSEAIEYDEDIVSSIVSKMGSLKADDGAIMFSPDNKYIITLFAGMLPLNKADKLSVKIYDNNAANYYMASYIIRKKKMEPIEVMFFYMRV